MCGIVGLYAYQKSATIPDREELRSIRDNMYTRGPDGKGDWYGADGKVALGHRRLAIIDLSPEAAQPMVSADGRFVVSFNGEIYNFPSLKNELEKKGYTFYTHSDTEVLLALYAEYGVEMVRRLRGMFAIILWDVQSRSMFLARDPFGIKPLYYIDNGRVLRVASQVKALLAGGGVDVRPEPAGIVGFYLLGSVPEPWTIYRDIMALPAGCYMQVDSQGISEPVPFYSVASTWKKGEQRPATLPETRTQSIGSSLLDSVRAHLLADVEVGAFLSAGVDSGALAGLMRQLKKSDGCAAKITTITLGFTEFTGQQEDETLLARQVAAQYGTTHTTRMVDRNEFVNDMPTILNAMDQPSIDGVNTWFAAKAARELGLKVVLSGLGGDELFGGYPSFTDIPRWVNILRPLSMLPVLGVLQQKIFTCLSHWAGIQPKLAGLVKYGGSYPGAWMLKRSLFMPWEMTTILDREVVKIGLDRLNLLAMIEKKLTPRPASSFGKVASMEMSLYMRNQLLRDTDWASMAHSVEVRVPLVDSTLLSAVAAAMHPHDLDGKKILGITPDPPLPVEVLERKKTGFSTPVQQWLTDPGVTQPMKSVDPFPSHQHWARSWALTVGRSEIDGIFQGVML